MSQITNVEPVDARPRLRMTAPRAGTPGGRLSVGRRPSSFWRIREDIPAGLRGSLAAVSITAPLVAWVLLVAGGSVNPIFLPNPLEVLSSLRDLAIEGLLVSDAQASVRRVAIGFGLSLLISVPLGLTMGTFKSIEALFEPLIGLLRYMPAPAFVPLLIIWLGFEEAPKVMLILIGTVFFNTLMIANVVWQVPTELIRVAFTLGASNLAVLRKVILPYSVPGVIDAARVNLAAAWNLIVVAELFAANEGLGFRIVRSQKFLQIDTIFAVLIVIGLLGLTSDLLLRIARDRLSPWSQE